MIKPEVYKSMDFDSDYAMQVAYENLRNKKCLHDIYTELYHKMMKIKDKFLNNGTDVLEIGSGAGFIKDLYPYVITSDVVMRGGGVDMLVNAENMSSFSANSLDAVFAMNVFHHIPDVNNFFTEVSRVVRPGGGVVMLEPYYGPVAGLLYRHIHPEPFDDKALNWKLPRENSGPMTGSNQAVSYLVFRRDYKKFKYLYPDLSLVYQEPCLFLRYMATGGCWLNRLLPEFVFPVLKGVEVLLKPFMRFLALAHIIVVKKS
jgi:SAM-dependent methyltransferase